MYTCTCIVNSSYILSFLKLGYFELKQLWSNFDCCYEIELFKYVSIKSLMCYMLNEKYTYILKSVTESKINRSQ